MEFIKRGREAIIQRLSEKTANKAHKVFGDRHDSNEPVRNGGLSK